MLFSLSDRKYYSKKEKQRKLCENAIEKKSITKTNVDCNIWLLSPLSLFSKYHFFWRGW